MTDRAVPNLPSRDLDRTAALYRSFGFVEIMRDDAWMILRRGGLQVEFFPFPDLDPSTSSFMCCLRVDDVDELYAAIQSSGIPEAEVGIPRLVPIRLQPWGLRAGYFIDPDGTQISLIEDRSD